MVAIVVMSLFLEKNGNRNKEILEILKYIQLTEENSTLVENIIIIIYANILS